MMRIGSDSFKSRLLLGSALYPSPKIMRESIEASETEIVTVALRRAANTPDCSNSFFEILRQSGVRLLPNTANCLSAEQAILTARMARSIFQTDWIKLEVIADTDALNPDPFELVSAAKTLIAEGFEVFPYTTDDLAVAMRLVDAGCKIVMPWAAPIGSGQGPNNLRALEMMRNKLPDTMLIVDAGLGKPSHAAQVMELGFDGVLLNSAVALADDPKGMAQAFKLAVEAGRLGYISGFMHQRNFGAPSTPTVGTPFWHQEDALV
jgi:thiazole synthase